MAGNRRNRQRTPARPAPRSWLGSGRTPQRQGNRRRRRGGWAAFWGDRERRRALLLSVLLHAGVLLALVFTYVAPEREPPEELIVLELTPPEPVAPQLEAAVDEPAAAEPEAAQDAADTALADTPVPDTPAAAAPAAASPAEPVPDLAEAEPEAAPAAPLPPAQRPPAPQVPSQAAAPTPTLPAQAPASTLPEIDVVEVAPQPLENSLALPTPNPEVSVTPARELAVTPQVELSETQELPTPEVVAAIATQEIELPQVQAEVAPEDALPLPEAQAEVASSPLPQPQVAATVTEAQALPQPELAAEVASREVPQPQAGAVVSEAQSVPQPAATAAAVPTQDVPQPQVGVVVGEAQSLAVTPGIELDAAAPLVTPEVSATVNVPTRTADQAAPAGDGSGSVPTSDPAAAQGEAAAGVTADAEVAELQSFEVTVERPLAVLLDNADAAYPQQGLVEASSVFEMPVEGGLTRLMSVYTRTDAAQLGPIRSARDYFLEASLAMNGTLVHVGGAPSTVSRIASQELATVDALQEGALFAQAVDRPAPHSTFAAGTTLRDAVGSLERQVRGTLYTPPADAPDVSALSVDYSADYASGFRYLSELDQYRWVRRDSQEQPVEAADAGGSAVTVDAVVVARVVAFPYPDDPEGRLYLPYSGGEATLYLRGKAIPGSWSPAGGFSFETEGDAQVDLTPYKHWILFAPETATLEEG